ncbi:hypothetical protein [Leptospirillum ferriphilum]|jgi:hypothetical protein|uniref:hypothetical protein n=1 Tax=Leptospirillum ferriphilum TaxID=178606 RepID=UPI0000F0C64B|nr:hypothetical protein [Leptospirillum ferriphilum]EAY57671.1 MAG: hypothetical protein UBAL2_82410067 [Leptospirillum rubarum]
MIGIVYQKTTEAFFASRGDDSALDTPDLDLLPERLSGNPPAEPADKRPFFAREKTPPLPLATVSSPT